ncbi:MAG: hypothetical protein HYY49_13855 [Ignavibacteriales bacterium]|nr:hypothetical protein [Ignavibacteriales bacterium]
MNDLLHVLKYKLIAFIKGTFDFRFMTVARGLGSLMVFGGFAVGAYMLSFEITRYVLENTRTGLYLYHRFISMMLFVFFVAVNLGNIIVSYATLYKSSEVNYFFTKPLSYATIFALKFFDNFLYSSTTLFLVAFMVLWGYGNYFGYPWYFFAGVMVFVLVPFMFLSACIAVLILMAIMKVTSRLGFRKVMALLFTVYFGFIFLFFRLSNPIKLVEEVNRYYPNVDQYLSQLTPGFLSYLPNHWVSEFLFFVARGEISQALPFAGIVFGVALAAFLVALLVANKFYYRSWLVSLEVHSSKSVPYSMNRHGFFDFRKKSILPLQTEVLLKKEFFSFIREPSQWIHLLVMMVLTFIFVLSIGNLNLRLRVTEIQLITYLVLFAFGGFLSCSLALRFVFPMISMEGNAFWSLLSAPLDRQKLYFTKFAVGFVVVGLLAEFVAIAVNLPFVRLTARFPLLLYFGVFAAFWMSLCIVAVNLGLGGYFPSYQEKNPIRVASTQGATLTFLVSLVYLITLVAIFILPLTRYFESLFVFRPFNISSIVQPGTLLAVVSAALAGFSMYVGMRALQRDF